MGFGVRSGDGDGIGIAMGLRGGGGEFVVGLGACVCGEVDVRRILKSYVYPRLQSTGGIASDEDGCIVSMLSNLFATNDVRGSVCPEEMPGRTILKINADKVHPSSSHLSSSDFMRSSMTVSFILSQQ